MKSLIIFDRKNKTDHHFYFFDNDMECLFDSLNKEELFWLDLIDQDENLLFYDFYEDEDAVIFDTEVDTDNMVEGFIEEENDLEKVVEEESVSLFFDEIENEEGVGDVDDSINNVDFELVSINADNDFYNSFMSFIKSERYNAEKFLEQIDGSIETMIEENSFDVEFIFDSSNLLLDEGFQENYVFYNLTNNLYNLESNENFEEDFFFPLLHYKNLETTMEIYNEFSNIFLWVH